MLQAAVTSASPAFDLTRSPTYCRIAVSVSSTDSLFMAQRRTPHGWSEPFIFLAAPPSTSAMSHPRHAVRSACTRSAKWRNDVQPRHQTGTASDMDLNWLATTGPMIAPAP